MKKTRRKRPASCATLQPEQPPWRRHAAPSPAPCTFNNLDARVNSSPSSGLTCCFLQQHCSWWRLQNECEAAVLQDTRSNRCAEKAHSQHRALFGFCWTTISAARHPDRHPHTSDKLIAVSPGSASSQCDQAATPRLLDPMGQSSHIPPASKTQLWCWLPHSLQHQLRPRHTSRQQHPAS
jgi:hypothetical protein